MRRLRSRTLPVAGLPAPKLEEGNFAAAYSKLAPEPAAHRLRVILIGLYRTRSHSCGELLK